MTSSITARIVILWAGFSAVALAQTPIIISDGPGQSSSVSSSPSSSSKVSISDGPSKSSNNTHGQIVTTDGPAQLPYEWPPKIVVTDGPSVLPYTYSSTSGGVKGQVVVSDGPGTTHVLAKPAPTSATPAQATPSTPTKIVVSDGPAPKHASHHTDKVAQAKKHEAAVDAETSTLAPMIPTKTQATAMPAVQAPLPAATSSVPNNASAWKIMTFILCFFVVAILSAFWATRKRVF